MKQSSMFGYYPIKMNKANEKYTNGLLALKQEHLKNLEITNFINSPIVKKVQNDFEEINRDIQNQYLKPSTNKFNEDNLFDAIDKLGIFGLELEQLYELGECVKNIKLNNDIYIGHNILYPNYESKWCFAEFKKESPEFINALFTDEEFSNAFVKLSAKDLFKRYKRLNEITSLEPPAMFTYILKNIRDDLNKGIEGAICYMPLKIENQLKPSEIRKKYQKTQKN